MLILWALGASALALVTARLYFGITFEKATMYVAMRTALGQMLHDLKVQKTKGLQHSKPAMHG